MFTQEELQRNITNRLCQPSRMPVVAHALYATSTNLFVQGFMLVNDKSRPLARTPRYEVESFVGMIYMPEDSERFDNWTFIPVADKGIQDKYVFGWCVENAIGYAQSYHPAKNIRLEEPRQFPWGVERKTIETIDYYEMSR